MNTRVYQCVTDLRVQCQIKNIDRKGQHILCKLNVIFLLSNDKDSSFKNMGLNDFYTPSAFQILKHIYFLSQVFSYEILSLKITLGDKPHLLLKDYETEEQTLNNFKVSCSC